MHRKFFQILYASKKSKARLGKINTAHGTVMTPAFVPVATKGTLKGILPELLKTIKIQMAFVNTYHLVIHPGADIIEKAGGIHAFSQISVPLMSDSAGFQVFSLKTNTRKAHIQQSDTNVNEDPLIIKLSEEGVVFRSVYDGQIITFTPEKSIEYQIKIGADIMMAFDECTYYPATHAYAEKAMKRTHEWLKRCITSKKKNSKNRKQYLYGIIQGATYQDLREESTKFVTLQEVDGIAIGGVAVHETKKEIREEVKWVSGYLFHDRPIHLLGVGQFDDIIDLVGYGIDTFDCVEPTRLARMGHLYQAGGRKAGIDIMKTQFKNDMSPIDKECNCYVCQNFTRAYIHHLFKQKELIGYTLATYHNLCVMEEFFEKLRKKIGNDEI